MLSVAHPSPRSHSLGSTHSALALALTSIIVSVPSSIRILSPYSVIVVRSTHAVSVGIRGVNMHHG